MAYQKVYVKIPAILSQAGPKYRMIMKTADGKNTFGAPFAPLNVTYTGFGKQWSEVPRAGRAPYLVNEANKLRKLSFTLIIADPNNPEYNANYGLRVLKRMADSSSPIKLTYGGEFDTGTWRMSNLEFTSQRRHPTKSYITWAEVQVELTAVNDVKLSTGPVKGGVKKKSTSTKKKKTSSSKSNSTSSSKTRYYTVKKGDTLSGIAIKLYGDASKWRALADRNKIKDPKKLQIGTKLKY